MRDPIKEMGIDEVVRIEKERRRQFDEAQKAKQTPPINPSVKEFASLEQAMRYVGRILSGD